MYIFTLFLFICIISLKCVYTVQLLQLTVLINMEQTNQRNVYTLGWNHSLAAVILFGVYISWRESTTMLVRPIDQTLD